MRFRRLADLANVLLPCSALSSLHHSLILKCNRALSSWMTLQLSIPSRIWPRARVKNQVWPRRQNRKPAPFSHSVAKAIAKKGYAAPTQIQKKCIPVALQVPFLAPFFRGVSSQENCRVETSSPWLALDQERRQRSLSPSSTPFNLTKPRYYKIIFKL